MSGSTDFNRNNLDCLRLIAASIVVFFHLGITGIRAFSAFGEIFSAHFAVNTFFVVSGLLIYRSYTRSSSVRSYLGKRVRRIYPAYFTIVTLSAVALCLLTTLPLSHYFGLGFWKYLGANLLFLNFLAPTLPGVFASNPMPAVNGALWTLKIEVAFYLFVPIMHFLCRRLGTRRVIVALFCLSCLWKYGFMWMAATHHASSSFSLDRSRGIFAELSTQFPGELLYFCAGVLVFLYFDTLKLHFKSIACGTAAVCLLDHFLTGGNLDVVWISGLVFVFGFWRYLGNFSKYGDFSYGVYIVHFPILQTLIALGLARWNPALFLLVFLPSIALASFLMWHLVESRFLASSSHYRLGARRTAAQA